MEGDVDTYFIALSCFVLTGINLNPSDVLYCRIVFITKARHWISVMANMADVTPVLISKKLGVVWDIIILAV